MTLSTDDWRVSDWDYGLVVTGKLNDAICQCIVGDDAALIVRAVNNHEALVAALRDMMPDALAEAEGGRITFTPAMEAARKLLASLE